MTFAKRLLVLKAAAPVVATLLFVTACGQSAPELRGFGQMLGLEDEKPSREAFLMISKTALLQIIQSDISERHNVSDTAAGVNITATGSTVGKVGIKMIPDDRQARFDAVVDLVTHLDIRGHHQPRSDIQIGISAVSDASSRAIKPFRVDLDLAKGEATSVAADASLRITGIEVSASGFFAGTKQRRAYEEAHATIARELPAQQDYLRKRIVDEVVNSVDEQAGQFLLHFNTTVVKTFREWFAESGFFPGKQIFQTTEDALWFSSVPVSESAAVDWAIAAPAGIESFVGGEVSPLMIGLSENALEHAAEKALGGKTMALSTLAQSLVAIGALAPPSLWSTIQYSNVIAVFPASKPLRLQFRGGKLRMVLHIDSIRQGAVVQPATTMELTYEPRLADDRSIEFMRVGDAKVTGGATSLEGNFLRALVASTIKPGLHGKFLLPFPDLSGVIAALKQLRLDFVRTEDGWIRLGASLDGSKSAGPAKDYMSPRG
jgi:hypothetical protein